MLFPFIAVKLVHFYCYDAIHKGNGLLFALSKFLIDTIAGLQLQGSGAVRLVIMDWIRKRSLNPACIVGPAAAAIKWVHCATTSRSPPAGQPD